MTEASLTPDNFRTLERLLTENSINNALRTAEVNSEFVLIPQDVSNFRDVTPGDGSVNYNNGGFQLSTAASSASTQALETAEIGRYRSGHVAVSGIYVQKDNPPVGVAEWGHGKNSSNDEIFFRYKSDESLELVVKRAGIETTIPESLWSVDIKSRPIDDENGDRSGLIYGFDAMDGSGESGLDLDPADGFIYRIDWSWYGGGIIVFNVVTPGKNGRQKNYPIAAFYPQGRTSIDKPNQLIFARLDNNGTATSDSLTVRGRQFSIFGN